MNLDRHHPWASWLTKPYRDATMNVPVAFSCACLLGPLPGERLADFLP